MRFYGIQPSELEAMDEHKRWLLFQMIDTLEARERWAMHGTMASVRGDREGKRDWLAATAKQAFWPDPETLAVAMESITRLE